MEIITLLSTFWCCSLSSQNRNEETKKGRGMKSAELVGCTRCRKNVTIVANDENVLFEKLFLLGWQVDENGRWVCDKHTVILGGVKTITSTYRWG